MILGNWANKRLPSFVSLWGGNIKASTPLNELFKMKTSSQKQEGARREILFPQGQLKYGSLRLVLLDPEGVTESS